MPRAASFIVALIVFLVLVFPAVSSARTTLQGPGYRSWMKRCVTTSKVPTPPVAVTVVIDPTYPAPGWALPGEARIGLSPEMARGGADGCQVLRHELGHIFDWTMLTQEDRRFAGCYILREPNPNPWWGYWDGSRWIYGGSQNSPQEHFAEAYRLVSTYSSLRARGDWFWFVNYVSYGIEGYFDRTRHAQFRRFIRTAAATRTPQVAQRDQYSTIAGC